MTGDLTLRWPTGQVTMQPRGAMLRDLQIQLTDGQLATPLHTAPWVGTPDATTQTGLMQGLSGEWPCIPFGTPQANLPPQWRLPEGWEDPFAHGYSAHHDWKIILSDDCLEAQIKLPPDHPVRALRRRVRPAENGISLDLWVLPRRDCRLPIGLHPVFSLPNNTGQMQLKVEGAEKVWCHPENPATDPGPALPGALSYSLASIQGDNGELLDFSNLPRNEKSETRLLLTGCNGTVTLADKKSHIQNIVQYNPTLFPYLMLWVSNRGRAAPPWSNRHLALGIEPVRAAFDLGSATSAAANPLSINGPPTAFDLIAGRPFHTTYAIKATCT